MGEVYRALDEGLGREVALKLTPRRQLEGSAGERFQREAELLARFQHPGVIGVHTWGVTPDWLYLVCELVEDAQTFDKACAERSMEGQVALGREVCEVLAALHAAGVVHRDVKPGNVLVTREGRIKLVDFGIATAEELRRLTLSGAFLGTPIYSAPERILLRAEAGDPSADVWSAAAMLYEVLTGRLPFEALSYVGLVGAAEAPPPPALELRPDLPEWVAVALDRALSLDPAARPSAAELARNLGGAAGRGRQGTWRRGGLWGAVLLAGAGAGWAALGARSRSPSAPPSAAPSREDASPARSAEGAWERILASEDRPAAARLARSALATGREQELVAALSEEAAVELLALGLLPPLLEEAELPPEWSRLSERLAAGRPGLGEAVRAAVRGRPWEEVAASLDAAQAAEPEAPWWLLRGLLAGELGLQPEPLPESVPAASGPWALRDWKTYLGLLTSSAKRKERLGELAERGSDGLLSDLIRARLLAEDSQPDLAAGGLGALSGRLKIRLEVLKRFATSQPTPLELVSAIDEEAPRGLRLYTDLLVVRAQWVLRTFERRPTRLGFRVAQRFVERSLDELEGSVQHQHSILEALVLRLPALRGFVQRRAGEAAQRWPGAAPRLKALAALARGLTPIPLDLALPPEWRERVEALVPGARPGVRRAVELALCGRPWSELEVQLSAARQAAPQEPGIPIARALLALARGANGVVTLEELCAELPEDWAGLIRSRWLRAGARPPDWLASLGLEYELDVARYPTPDLARLRELAPRHSEAAFALARARLPEQLAAEHFEAFLIELDPQLEQTGALYVGGLVPRAPAAWSLAQARAGGVLVGLKVVNHTLELAPDGPALLSTWGRILSSELWQRLLIEWAPRWPQSAAAQGQAGCIYALAGQRGGQPPAGALKLLDRAQALEPGWRPSASLLKQLRDAFPELCAERFGDE